MSTVYVVILIVKELPNQGDTMNAGWCINQHLLLSFSSCKYVRVQCKRARHKFSITSMLLQKVVRVRLRLQTKSLFSPSSSSVGPVFGHGDVRRSAKAAKVTEERRGRVSFVRSFVLSACVSVDLSLAGHFPTCRPD